MASYIDDELPDEVLSQIVIPRAPEGLDAFQTTTVKEAYNHHTGPTDGKEQDEIPCTPSPLGNIQRNGGPSEPGSPLWSVEARLANERALRLSRAILQLEDSDEEVLDRTQLPSSQTFLPVNTISPSREEENSPVQQENFMNSQGSIADGKKSESIIRNHGTVPIPDIPTHTICTPSEVVKK